MGDIEKGHLKVKQPFCATRDDEAPLFKADSYYQGKMVPIELKDARGKWVILFFYSSNFTFV